HIMSACVFSFSHISSRLPIRLLIFPSMIPPLPISTLFPYTTLFRSPKARFLQNHACPQEMPDPIKDHTLPIFLVCLSPALIFSLDRKSTRLNSSHGSISYAVFCLKKKKQENRAASTHELTLASRHNS